jgi:hypothetical protein
MLHGSVATRHMDAESPYFGTKRTQPALPYPDLRST